MRRALLIVALVALVFLDLAIAPLAVWLVFIGAALSGLAPYDGAAPIRLVLARCQRRADLADRSGRQGSISLGPPSRLEEAVWRVTGGHRKGLTASEPSGGGTSPCPRQPSSCSLRQRQRPYATRLPARQRERVPTC